MTAVVDWREADSADVVPLVTAEASAWLAQLHWDVADAWHVIEPARAAGHLPGAVAFDPTGRPIGWTAYLRHGASVQVMALVAPTEDATDALLDTVMASDEAVTAESAIVCVRDASPGLERALAARGFAVEPYRYLRCDLRPSTASPDTFEPWPESADEVSRLFQAAYASEGAVRAFAPNGRLDEWMEYLAQLRKGPGCGWFLADLSLSSRDARTGHLDGAILVTHLGPGTIHVAQLAVDPRARRRGLGRTLVRAALARAAGQYDRATLLVAAANHAACALYDSFGFREVSRFLVATRRQPQGRWAHASPADAETA